MQYFKPMGGGETNPTEHPIQLLVNYWELRPAAMGARLDKLLRTGVTHIATFIPWQAVESDINHTLLKFLQAVAERKMTLWLILTPEVGVHFPYSGLPRDLFTRAESELAKHAEGGPVAVALPPNLFHLPSLSAPEFTKRYHNFLTRVDALLAEVGRHQAKLLQGVTTVMTGSFWKYYRSPHRSSQAAFAGETGDISGPASVAFRQRVDQYFSQREFTEPSLPAAARWKTRALEEVNRRWFHQQCEDVFRARSAQFVRRKAVDVKVRQVELFTPEADPGCLYSSYLQLMTGGAADFGRLSRLADEAATRGSPASPFLHWTGLGAFRSLSDSEKQFLIVKSLLLMGGRGGGVLIDESEWFSLSASFRARAESLARSLAHHELKLVDRALYLAPHLWSGAGTLWDEIHARVGAGARVVSSIDHLVRCHDARLLVVDPTFILTREAIGKLAAWTRGGRVTLLPRSPLYTDAARVELDQATAGADGMQIDLGVPYRLFPSGDGKILIYDLPEGLSMSGEALTAWQRFLASALSLANVQGPCSLSDGRLGVVPLERKGGGCGLFVLNSSARSVAADILFPVEVTVSDLTSRLSPESKAADGADAPQAPQASGRFSLEVPPCGILPLSVHGLGDDIEERKAAQATAELTRRAPVASAQSELAGFDEAAQGGSPWS